MEQVVLLLDVRNCVRCGGDHDAVEVKPLTRPSEEWGYWAMCPAVNEPIMMAVEEG